ncbi:MAG: ABC transporter substrate-binding protein [Pseudomonadota bacterium]
MSAIGIRLKPLAVSKKSCFFALILVALFFSIALPLPREAICEPASDKTGRASVILTDGVGRRVTAPEKVERIACLYAFSGHVVTLLGRGKDIVAVSFGLKRDSLLLEICPAIQRALVPKAQGAINIEELLKARPDIVFVPGDVATDPGEMDQLDKFHIPYLVIDYSSIDTQQAAVELIGKAIGAADRAAAFIAYYQGCIERVAKKTADIPESRRPRLYHSVNEPLRTTIDKGLAIDWLRVTGCRNVALGPQPQRVTDKNYTSLEQVLLWDPEVILTNEPKTADEILRDGRWAMLSAVKRYQVYSLPIGISRWGHPGSIETPLAILWTAAKLYPERFADLDMAAETRAFYQSFFHYALSEETVQRMLSGKMERKPKRKGGPDS